MFRQQLAGTNQIAESFFRNQAAHCDDQRRNGGKICAPEFGEIKTVVNAVDTTGALWKSLTQELRRVVRFRDDCACRIDEFVQSDFKMRRHEDIVRVCGKTEGD